jgi:hypothetical protein
MPPVAFWLGLISIQVFGEFEFGTSVFADDLTCVPTLFLGAHCGFATGQMARPS